MLFNRMLAEEARWLDRLDAQWRQRAQETQDRGDDGAASMWEQARTELQRARAAPHIAQYLRDSPSEQALRAERLKVWSEEMRPWAVQGAFAPGAKR